MEHLFRKWSENKSLFTRPIFLMSDFDGTLAPIAEHPEDAEMSGDMRKCIIELSNICPVAIVTGRPLGEIRSKVEVEGIYYAGNHGYEIEGPGVSFVREGVDETVSTIKTVCESIEKRSANIEGIIVENKEMTASVHYRLVDDEKIPRLRRIVEEEIESAENEKILEFNHGKMVFEIRPGEDWDKGKAIDFILHSVEVEEDTMPIYLGDDLTDEDAFSELEDKGISVLVSVEERESAADFILNGPQEVKAFFERLIDVLGS